MKLCLVFIFLFVVLSGIYAQDDSQAAQQYVQWIQRAIDEGRWSEAQSALNRADDFKNVSSDISYLQAVSNNYHGASRIIVIRNLDAAIETNRWVIYNENHAQLLKAQMLLAMRNYYYALACLDNVSSDTASNTVAGSAQMRADAAMFRLLALRGIGSVTALAQFRSLVLGTIDRFPRDPRPLRIFFEYANTVRASNINPVHTDLPESDINLLELALRRLPFLLEADPELAWLAAPFMRDTQAARRLLSSYRSGGIPHIQNRDFVPHPGSIPVALNLGLIDDITAVQELFSGRRGFNYPSPPEISSDGNPVINKKVVNDVYNLLRSEEGREYFAQSLLSFTGFIYTDDDNDNFIDSYAFLQSGVITQFTYDENQSRVNNLKIYFDAGGVPVSAAVLILGQYLNARLEWERYPSVKQVTAGNEVFLFGPADLQYAPVSFIEFGGSYNLATVLFPVPAFQYINLTYQTLLSFCSSITRPSPEIDGAAETIFLNRGVLLQAVETLNGKQVSVTEFSRGLPVIQHIDLDLDGRMETIRRFRRPPQDYVWQDFLDYRRLIASSESDWSGDGRFKTMEVYQPDGSIVYYFDMDGSGQWTHSDTEIHR